MTRMLEMILITASVVLAGCQGTILTAVPSLASTELPGQTIKLILDEKNTYQGKQVTIEGKLEAEGQGLDVRFFLRADSGERLEVSPWAPLEVMHPQTGTAQVQSMASFVGWRLKLTGIIENGRDGVILNVSQVGGP